MNKNTFSLLMSSSKADRRREHLMAESGAINEAHGYDTAYEWADAVEEVIETLQKQINVLKDVYNHLDCYEKAQGCVEAAMWQIEKAIETEEKVSGRFWTEKPDDFRR